MKIERCGASGNNGSGLLVHGYGDGIHVVDSNFDNNGRAGIEVREPASTYASLGIHGLVDGDELLQLRCQLLQKAPELREVELRQTTFFEKYGKRIADITSFLANLAKITGIDLVSMVIWLKGQMSLLSMP